MEGSRTSAGHSLQLSLPNWGRRVSAGRQPQLQKGFEQSTRCLRSAPSLALTLKKLQGSSIRQNTRRLAVRAQAGQASSPATFSIRVPFLQLGFGDVVKLVGEQENFGGWSLSAAPALAWTEGHNWVGTFELAPDTYQFKIVIVRQGGNNQWENGDDRLLQVSSDLDDREVVCTFNHTAEMPISDAPAQKESRSSKQDTVKAEATLQEMQESQPALADVQPEQLSSVTAQDLQSSPEAAEDEAAKLEVTQSVAAAAGFADEAPRQPPADDELEAASAFVTGDSASAPAMEAAAPEAAPQPPQEPEPVVASEPEPEPEPVPEPEAAPERPQATASSAQSSEQETTVNIEGTPISVAIDGTMTFSFDEGDTTDDAATLAAKLIPDLPDVSSVSFLNNGGGNGTDTQGAASFAADFADSASTKAAALPMKAKHGLQRSMWPFPLRFQMGHSLGRC
ncbi:hypothetical protein WJX74_000373 [Apatococcus lobatus]|uniref:CBM20 domain-containing protein n=1 Tax=Apatococcus lobatus TaxID=904363 RepID=A0AAW1RIT0_9CHLO